KTLIEDSVHKVDAGSELVDEAGKTMDEIVSSVKRVTDIISGTAVASQEQSAGIEQINQAVGQMDEITQQNAALVEQAAAAAESLQNQAAKLTELVGAFTLVRGERGHRQAGQEKAASFQADAGRRASVAGQAMRQKQLAAR
ncbi:MAG TPA: methyl-accepting chemotaxis protein, partial [Thiobacillus sp.]